MIFPISFVVLLVSVTQAATSDDEIPFVVASQPQSDPKPSNLLPEQPDVPPVLTSTYNRGRSDIEIQDDQPIGGYFYPKPLKPFNLPSFTTLDANAPQPASFVEESEQLDRERRSPQRRRGRRPYFPSPPPFVPGFIPPNQIRPLPALYGRPMGYF